MDSTRVENLKKKLENLKEEGEGLQEDRKSLYSDRQLVGEHRLALVKKENGQKLSKQELEAIAETKDNYSSYFEDEVEESDPEVETSPEYKERKTLTDISEYIKDELASNKSLLENNIKEFKRLDKVYRTLVGMPSNSESAQTSTSETQTIQNQTPSTSPNQTPSDYIDNLPREHNPFDDLGDD